MAALNKRGFLEMSLLNWGLMDDEEEDDYGSMFGPKLMDWVVTSEKDPRWDGSGECRWLISGGLPKEVKDHLSRKKKSLGKRPDDLEFACMKR